MTPVVEDRDTVKATPSSNFDAAALAEMEEEEDNTIPGYYNKPRIISYPNLNDTIDKVSSPDSYVNFLRHLSKQCKAMRKTVGQYSDSQLELFYKTTGEAI